MAVRKHQELQAWQEAMRLAENVYALTANFPDVERFGLIGQMRRAAVSVPSNIAEGAARGGNKEFIHFLHIARGSLSELDTQLLLAKRLGFSGDFAATESTMDSAFKYLGGLINALGKRQ